MGEILGCLCGIFVGLTTSWYFQIKPMNEKDNTIEQQKEENLQVCNENKDLRAENEDLKDDLSIAYKEIEMKEKLLQMFTDEITRNDYNRPDIHLKHLKELASQYQRIS